MKTIINTTPHNVNICDDNGKVVNTFPKSDNPIRLETSTNRLGDINGIPVSNVVFGGTILPIFCTDTYFIVSALVKNAYPDRQDFLVPHDLVRDADGNIIGCKGFSI